MKRFDMKKIADNIRVLKGQWTQGALPSEVNLDYEIGTLSKIIQDGKLNESGLAVAYYYRGDANLLINVARVNANRPADVDAARNALADYDKVIARGKDIADWGVDVANAAYYAGWISQRYLNSLPLAYSYWEKCSDMSHAGCQSSLAIAKVTGVGGVTVDIGQALALNGAVYNTGTNYGCAGAYAARNNSLIIFFTDSKRPAKEGLEWWTRSRTLLDSLAKEQSSDNPCNRARFDVMEYLMLYSRGDEQQVLLKKATQAAESEEDRAIASYLNRDTNEEQFRAQLARSSTKPGKCAMHFIALWNAEINRNGGVARDHFKAMQDLGPENCGYEIAFAKKFGR